MTIWKFPIPTIGLNLIMMPYGADVLSVQVQRGLPMVWALLDERNHATRQRRIFVFPTGFEFEAEKIKFVGTFQNDAQSLVYHVFDGGYSL